MPTGKYSSDNPIADIIPLEGAFVSVFLADAPAVYVKIYIYCLYLCQHPDRKFAQPSEMAAAIGCTPDELTAALGYWNEMQLLHYGLRPLHIELNSAFIAAKQHSAYIPDALHAYSDYFAALRALFPDRNLSPSEYDKARDWLEVYGLPQEVVLMLVNHTLATVPNSKKLTFNYIDKVALSWTEDNIKTTDAAEEYLQLYEARQHQAGKILLHLGIKRTPTMDEIRLYDKWTKKLGFTLDAILAACREMTKTVNPSFAYLDKVLASLHALGLHDTKSIKARLDNSESENKLVSAVLHELGLHMKANTPELVMWINRFSEAGFAPDALTFIARGCAHDGIRSFKKYCERMLWWQEKAIFTPSAMEQYQKDNPDASYTSVYTQKQKPQIKQTNAHIFAQHDNIDFSKLYTDLDTLEDLV